MAYETYLSDAIFAFSFMEENKQYNKLGGLIWQLLSDDRVLLALLQWS